MSLLPCDNPVLGNDTGALTERKADLLCVRTMPGPPPGAPARRIWSEMDNTSAPTTPTVDGSDLALPGPHPHTSADFEDWGGIGLDERRTKVVDEPVGELVNPDRRNVALPGPHVHESADFGIWGGHDGTSHPTPREVVPTSAGPVRVYGAEPAPPAE